MDAVTSLEALNPYHWFMIASALAGIAASWGIARYMLSDHNVRINENHRALTDHKLHVSENYARKNEVKEAVQEVKQQLENVRKDVIEAIVSNRGPRR